MSETVEQMAARLYRLSGEESLEAQEETHPGYKEQRLADSAACKAGAAALEVIHWLEKNADALNHFGYRNDGHWELIYNDGNRIEGASIRDVVEQACLAIKGEPTAE